MRLYKYYSYNPKITVEDNFLPLIHKTIRFSSPMCFNDVYDCKCVQVNFDGSITFEFTEKIAQHIHISSFSMNPFSPIMWSHYASNHAGYVIEYDLKLDNLVKVDYQVMKPKSFDLREIHSDIISKYPHIIITDETYYKLQNDLLVNNPKYIKKLMDAVFIKHIDWKYEEEFRSFIVDINGFNEPYNDIKIDDSCIKQVILGYKFDLNNSLEKVKHINQISFGNNLQLTHAQPKLDEYSMDITSKKI